MLPFHLIEWQSDKRLKAYPGTTPGQLSPPLVAAGAKPTWPRGETPGVLYIGTGYTILVT